MSWVEFARQETPFKMQLRTPTTCKWNDPESATKESPHDLERHLDRTGPRLLEQIMSLGMANTKDTRKLQEIHKTRANSTTKWLIQPSTPQQFLFRTNFFQEQKKDTPLRTTVVLPIKEQLQTFASILQWSANNCQFLHSGVKRTCKCRACSWKFNSRSKTVEVFLLFYLLVSRWKIWFQIVHFLACLGSFLLDSCPFPEPGVSKKITRSNNWTKISIIQICSNFGSQTLLQTRSTGWSCSAVHQTMCPNSQTSRWTTKWMRLTVWRPNITLSTSHRHNK